jgi:hypothetical protein
MNRNSLALSHVLALVAAFAALAGPASAADIDRTVLDDGTTLSWSAPDSATDSNGRIHLAVQGWTTTSSSNREIYYLMLDRDGDVLIAPTMVNTADAARESRPRIVVLSDDRVVITFQGNSEPLRYVLINPAGDDRNGNAANPADAAFLVTTETNVGVSTLSGEHDSEVGSDDTVHVVRQETDELRYLSFNPATGAAVTAEVDIGNTEWRGSIPAIGVDRDDNVHLVAKFDDPVDDFAPVVYMMLDGTDGSIMIDASPLYDGAGGLQHSSHWSLMMSGNKVDVVYGDKRFTADFDSWCNSCGQGGDMFYTRIDPGQHPQDGSAGTMAQLREGDESHIGGIWYARAFRSGSRIHVFSVPGTNNPGGDSGNDGIMIHASVTPGSGSVSSLRAFNTHAVSANWSKHYVTSAGGKVFWVERVFSPVLTGEAYQLVMANVSSFGGGGGGGGSPGLPLLLVFGLAGLLRRMHRQ